MQRRADGSLMIDLWRRKWQYACTVPKHVLRWHNRKQRKTSIVFDVRSSACISSSSNGLSDMQSRRGSPVLASRPGSGLRWLIPGTEAVSLCTQPSGETVSGAPSRHVLSLAILTQPNPAASPSPARSASQTSPQIRPSRPLP